MRPITALIALLVAVSGLTAEDIKVATYNLRFLDAANLF